MRFYHWPTTAACLALLLSAPATAQTIERTPAANPNAPYSAAVAHGDTLYLAGVLGMDPETRELGEGVQEQTRLALASLQSALENTGSDAGQVLNCTVFLADMGDYAAMNEVFAAFFADARPARTTVQAQPPLDAAVEISCVAAAPSSAPDVDG